MSGQSGKALAALDMISETAAQMQSYISDSAITRDMEEVKANLRELRSILSDADALVRSSRATSWMTTSDVSQYLKITPSKVRDLSERGLIRSYRLDPNASLSHLRFDRHEIDQDIKGVISEVINGS